MGFKFEQYFATRRLMAFTPAPDGNSVYFVSDISGQFNLWRVAAGGGWPNQLTVFTANTVRSVSVSKDGARLAFVADPDGNERYQVYLMDAQGGWPEQVTHQPEVEHQPGAFSPDGRTFAYTANAANPRDTDIFLRDVETGEVRQLTPGARLMVAASFSPDGTQLLATEDYSNTDQDLWVFNLATGEGRNLTAHPGREAKHFPGPWRKDGKGFYFISDDQREFLAVGYYDLEADRKEYVITPDWDVEALAVSGRHDLMAYAVNEAGCSVLHVVDLTTGKELPLPTLPKGIVANLKFAGQDEQRRLFVQMGAYNQAGALYVLDLDRQEFRLLTPSMLGNIPAESFVEPDLVHIETFDGQKVPAWLYRPAGLAPGQKVPAVLSIHGGPETQERAGYNYGGFYQYLLSRGIAILAPNVRGSTGFGIKWQKAIHRDWGGAELKDMEACARYLQSLDFVDGERLGVWGGSFGGFATLSCASRLPGYWACAVDFCGPSNLVTFAGSVPEHWKPVMKGWVGDPEEDREMLLERSPITYVDQIRCPLMVVQGATDPRVVKAESDQMVERLRALGREVEYLVFEDEGHGFTRRTNQLKGYGAMADFLIKHLVG
ncbi:MAG TPA: S9 family peptidase [Symbiobacteriaceae bacterium]|nr:S9 family peptidase [Symbiobacteriaceae bacterium]